MTLPSGGTISLGQVGGEFGYGYDFASYYGVYYGRGGLALRFQLAGNPFNLSDFYSAYKITGGSGYLGTGYWTVPVYNSIYAQVKGGDGGQAGAWGYNSCGGYPTGSAGGSAGGTSSFGGYVAAGGGGGGGGNNGSGGTGATASGSWTNPVQGGGGPTSGNAIYITVGGGGAGGSGGSNCANYPYYYGPVCLCPNNAANGSAGAAGYVYVSWS